MKYIIFYSILFLMIHPFSYTDQEEAIYDGIQIIDVECQVEIPPPLPKIKRHLLITGCGRSGTTYIAALLQEAGLDIQHEEIGVDGCSSWFMAVKDNNTACGLGCKNIEFTHIFHQTRHPLDTIPSLETMRDRSWEYVMRHLPQIKPSDSATKKAAKYWVFWNLKAEKRAEWTYKVEDVDFLLDEFEDRIGRYLDRTALQRVPKNANTREHRNLTWQQLKNEVGNELFFLIQMASRKYGYSLTDE